MPICGGMGEPKPADADIQAIANTVKADLEGKAGKTFPEYTVISYASQVVAGTNFFLKVFLGAEEYAHLRVFRPLPHTNEGPSLHGYQLTKTKEEPITYF